MQLTNNKIRLRALEPADADLLYNWENNTENWSVTNTFIPFSREILLQYILSVKDIYADKQFRFVIESITENKAVGLIDLFDFDPFHARAGFGILIADDSDRNKGYAGSAVELAMEYCRNTLLLHSVFCNVTSDNENSIQLFIKAGFEITGTKKSWHRKGSAWADEHFMQLVF